jgi:hypothetical protein
VPAREGGGLVVEEELQHLERFAQPLDTHWAGSKRMPDRT